MRGGGRGRGRERGRGIGGGGREEGTVGKYMYMGAVGIECSWRVETKS